MTNDKTRCEYCAYPLPLGVDKATRRKRTHHFQTCENRPRPDVSAVRPLVDLNDPAVRLYLIEQGWTAP